MSLNKGVLPTGSREGVQTNIFYHEKRERTTRQEKRITIFNFPDNLNLFENKQTGPGPLKELQEEVWELIRSYPSFQ